MAKKARERKQGKKRKIGPKRKTRERKAVKNNGNGGCLSVLKPDESKSSIRVEIESWDSVYFKKTEPDTPVYVGDNIVWVKNYFCPE